MFRTLAGATMVLGGIALAAICIRSYLKETSKLEDNNEFKKPLQVKHLFGAFTGLCFIILGIMAVLSLLNDNVIELSAVTILLIDSIIERKVDKKVNGNKKK